MNVLYGLTGFLFAAAFVAWVTWDRASFEVLMGQPGREAFWTALYIGIAASGTTAITFLNYDAVEGTPMFLRVLIQFVALSLITYGAATKGVSYRHGHKLNI